MAWQNGGADAFGNYSDDAGGVGALLAATSSAIEGRAIDGQKKE
jgi:hypothetical protein